MRVFIEYCKMCNYSSDSFDLLPIALVFSSDEIEKMWIWSMTLHDFQTSHMKMHENTQNFHPSEKTTLQLKSKVKKKPNDMIWYGELSDCAIIGGHFTESWMVFLFWVISEWHAGGNKVVETRRQDDNTQSIMYTHKIYFQFFWLLLLLRCLCLRAVLCINRLLFFVSSFFFCYVLHCNNSTQCMDALINCESLTFSDAVTLTSSTCQFCWITSI